MEQGHKPSDPTWKTNHFNHDLSDQSDCSRIPVLIEVIHVIGSDIQLGPFGVTKIITPTDPAGKHAHFGHNLSDRGDHECSNFQLAHEIPLSTIVSLPIFTLVIP